MYIFEGVVYAYEVEKCIQTQISEMVMVQHQSLCIGVHQIVEKSVELFILQVGLHQFDYLYGGVLPIELLQI
jgi:hypothetical protein